MLLKTLPPTLFGLIVTPINAIRCGLNSLSSLFAAIFKNLLD